MPSSSPTSGPSSPSSAVIFWGSDSDDEPLHHNFHHHHTSNPSSQQTHQSRPRLTLSSPRLFPRDFLTLPAPNASTRTQSFLRPQEYRDAANNLGRALENANRSLQDAQEAFHVAPQSALVDLTSSSRSQSPEIERTTYPSHRVQSRERTRRAVPDSTSNTQNDNRHLPPPFRPLRHSLESPNPHPPNESDYLLDRRSVARQQNFHPRIPQSVFNRNGHRIEPFAFLPRPPPTEQELQTLDERAIQRQRDARALWDSNQRHRQQTQQSHYSEPEFSSPSPTTEEADLPKQEEDSAMQNTDPHIESIDLTGVDEITTLSAALSRQRQDAIASQTASTADGTGCTPLTSYKCPICMETPTDATSTICGHLFCHRCIIETLKWSQDQRQDDMPHNAKAKGVCPVCRKQMDRKDGDGQRMRTLVPLNLMLGQQVKKRKRDKGKGVLRDGKENSAKKRKTSEEIWDLVHLE